MPELSSGLSALGPSERPNARVLPMCLECLSALSVFKCALRARTSDQIRSEQNTKYKKMLCVCVWKKTKVAKNILRNLILKNVKKFINNLSLFCYNFPSFLLIRAKLNLLLIRDFSILSSFNRFSILSTCENLNTQN